ncbi:MAG TPA: EAL domain-containing protein [Acidimicrobiales bacterium]|nr:EAL domain-containing protein [Acidimicrobiales bacterium]
MAAPITVVVVDDHEMVRESLIAVLSRDPTIRVAGAAATGKSGVALAVAEQADVVVMDFVLPDMTGATAIGLLKAQMPDVKVITVSGLSVPGAYQAAAAAGSTAWLRKTSAVRELAAAIHQVYAGEAVLDNEMDGLPSLDELVVHFQPVNDLATKAVVGFEALVRRRLPGGGLGSPLTFMPQAEMVGMVSDLDRRVAETAARQVHEWQRQFPRDTPIWVSVNLSGMDMRRPDLAEWVAGAVDAAGIAPSSLVLEITETVLVQDTVHTIRRLGELRAIGVRLSLDDFGSGFSSLAYLRRFPFDFLKIDKGFTEELPHSERAMRMVDAIQKVVSTLGLHGIAEGIERAEQAQALKRFGWSYGQGYLFSRPIPAEDCAALLR